MPGAHDLWAGRDLYCASPVVTQDLDFSGFIQRTTSFSQHLEQAMGFEGPILTRILTGPHLVLFDTQRDAEDLFLPRSSLVRVISQGLTTSFLSSRPVGLLLIIFIRPDLTSISPDQTIQNIKKKSRHFVLCNLPVIGFMTNIFWVKFKRKHCFCWGLKGFLQSVIPYFHFFIFLGNYCLCSSFCCEARNCTVLEMSLRGLKYAVWKIFMSSFCFE
jgi:hypothetical protein